MFTKRYPSAAVSITTAPRSTLPQTYHKDIDTILKDLRVCSRRLKSALDNFTNELRTLERLYYKCKNQHRMALFFKRVSEIRRYGGRLCELNILERVDLLRASFVGLEYTNDQKALRGSWSHVPEETYVTFLRERMTASSTLVCKMRERLENAYHHFTLAVQTGAFVQVIVLFSAISSRMFVLSLELEEALRLGISACNRLFIIIHPRGKQTTPTRQLPLLQPEPLVPSHIDNDDLPEDAPLVSCYEPMDRGEELGIRIAPPTNHRLTKASDNATAPTSKKATLKTRAKKAKKKFDEIDEIFGFS